MWVKLKKDASLKAVLAVAAMVIGVAALTLLLEKPPLFSGEISSAERSTRPKSVFASIISKGEGKVLVNGSEVTLVNSTEHFSLKLQAEPGECWFFKWWLVNGTVFGTAPELQLHIRGNTAVEAVFERPRYVVAFTSDAEGGSLVVNGSILALPAEVEAPACSLLQVTPIPPEGWDWPWGTLLIPVEGNRTVHLGFAKTAALVALRGVLVPVNVTVAADGNASSFVLARDSSIRVKLNASMRVEPHGADRRGCVIYNETHLVCLASWLVNGSEWPSPRLYNVAVAGDLELEQVVVYTRLAYPVKYTEIPLPNGTMVKAPVIPGDRWMIVPFIGEYEYLGNGVLKLEGGRVKVFIKPPEGWRKIRVYANLTTTPSKIADSSIKMVIRNKVDFLSCGRDVLPTGSVYGTGYVVILFDREALRAWSTPGHDPFFTPEFGEYIKCELAIENGVRMRSCGQAQSGPAPRVLEGIGEGWLDITSYGTMYVRIEVVEFEG